MRLTKKEFFSMKQDQKGLTLIESMMVVALIGILATIAIPPAFRLYEDSQARAQVTEALDLLGRVKSPVAAFYSDKGRWPTSEEFDNLVPARTGKYVASLTPESREKGFEVIAKFRNTGVSPALVTEGSGRTLVLATANGKEWFCNDNTDPVSGIPDLVPGNVLPQHRPSSCK
ncbi:N-terminal methylation site [Nitrosospira multiformis ATCC 25196]|uniref:N-terminal methylation site n=2 Tax=Nitrosospira multiformis (strain ATCC 25196 / NCIMB 11849 / C 71) TaxID=323848 RepID=Q2Y657_NITMU|nr:N-terminal methylation site [Nitrosospira multiformis ATCC 25196]